MAEIQHTEPAPTLEEVWRLFRETDQRMQETGRQIEKTTEQMRETDLKFQETDRKFQETDRKFQETDRKINELSSHLGSHGHRLGEFVQEMVRPALVRLFRSRDLPVHQVMPNVAAYDDDGRFVMEIDLLVINASTAIAVECKSRLSVDDVNEHLERMDQFKAHFPQYGEYTLLGAVAGMVLPGDVGRYAYRRGLYVLAQSGDGVTLLNDPQFEPATW